MATDKFTVTLIGVFAAESITDKAGLNRWCGAEGRDRLYDSVKRVVPTEWATDPHPEERVRWAYQRLLDGYSIKEKAAAKLLAKVAKEALAKVAKEAAKEAKAAAKAAAAEVARPTPYDGLHIVNGILYMVDEKTNNVFDYDVATETVGDRVGLWVDGHIEYEEPEVIWTAMDSYLTPPGTVVATVIAPVPGPKPAPVAQAKTAASAVKRAATKEAKAVILRAQIARLQEQLARRQSELAALSG